jgi:hypothetical protein
MSGLKTSLHLRAFMTSKGALYFTLLFFSNALFNAVSCLKLNECVWSIGEMVVAGYSRKYWRKILPSDFFRHASNRLLGIESESFVIRRRQLTA